MKINHNCRQIRNNMLVLAAILPLAGCYATTNIGNKDVYYAPGEETLALGKEVYDQYCIQCHGEGMQGDGPEANIQEKPPADLTAKKIHLTQTSVKGVLDYPHYSHEALQDRIKYGNNVMPPLKDILSNAEIEAVIQYIKVTIRAAG